MLALLQFHIEPTLYRFGLLQFIYTDLRGSYQYVEMKWNEEVITKYTNRERERERERERVVPSEGSVVAVWAFEMSNDTRKKTKRQ